MSKFPLVTVEKGQGVQDESDPRYAEDKIVDTLRRVKAKDANISTIFYYNSVLDWPFYKLHEDFLDHPEWWLKKKDGSVCRISGDWGFPNHTDMLVFDFAQKDVRDFWASECLNMTKTGVVDGCFSDRADGTPCGAGQEYKDGHIQVHRELQQALGDGVLIANHAYTMPGVNAVMIEYFKNDEQSIKDLMLTVKNGKMTFAHASWACTKDLTDTLAAFLIGAGARSYYACSRGWKVQADPIESAWREEYDRDLGEPTGLAVKTGDVYRREFKHPKGTTVVTFNVSSNSGKIAWAGAPPPPPALVPGSCNVVYEETGVANHDITPTPWSQHTRESPEDCCAACWAVDACVAWTWHTDGTQECHLHDSWAGQHLSPGLAPTSGHIRTLNVVV